MGWNESLNVLVVFLCGRVLPLLFEPTKYRSLRFVRSLCDGLRLEVKKKELEKKMLAEAKVQLPFPDLLDDFFGYIFSLKLLRVRS